MSYIETINAQIERLKTKKATPSNKKKLARLERIVAFTEGRR